MRILGFNFGRKANNALTIDQVIKRLDAIFETASGVTVTPENCEDSPTVKAIITAVTRRFAVMPVHVYQKTRTSAGLAKKELQPNHPVEKLLARPNDWQSRANYWMDSASWLMRYGNFYAYKGRGVTGPIRQLKPLLPGSVRMEQDDNWDVTFKVSQNSGRQQEYTMDAMHHVRLSARNGFCGDSPVMDSRESIAVEIAAEKFGAALFGNGAMPGMVFEYIEGSQGHKTDTERQQFVEDVQRTYAKKGRFKALMMPKGIKLGTQIGIDNDKAQFLGLREYQRTVIAGAFGIPPHLVGDLSKGTYNNVEQQDSNFTTNVILPLVTIFEAAMERDLLTDEDRRNGIIIRFNPDAIIRASFIDRQNGLAIQRQNGVINADEWREHENMNPRADGGGEAYYMQGPSGQQPSSNAAPKNGDPQNAN